MSEVSALDSLRTTDRHSGEHSVATPPAPTYDRSYNPERALAIAARPSAHGCQLADSSGSSASSQDSIVWSCPPLNWQKQMLQLQGQLRSERARPREMAVTPSSSSSVSSSSSGSGGDLSPFAASLSTAVPDAHGTRDVERCRGTRSTERDSRGAAACLVRLNRRDECRADSGAGNHTLHQSPRWSASAQPHQAHLRNECIRSHSRSSRVSTHPLARLAGTTPDAACRPSVEAAPSERPPVSSWRMTSRTERIISMVQSDFQNGPAPQPSRSSSLRLDEMTGVAIHFCTIVECYKIDEKIRCVPHVFRSPLTCTEDHVCFLQSAVNSSEPQITRTTRTRESLPGARVTPAQPSSSQRKPRITLPATEHATSHH